MGGIGAAVPGREHPIAIAPEHQRGDADVAELHLQSRVGHPVLGGEHAHGLHVGALRRDPLGRERRRVDEELLRIVPGVLGLLLRAQTHEVDDRLARHLDARAVDDDDAADPAFGVARRHLCRDPAPQRGADHQHVGQAAVGEQLQVRAGERRNVVQPLGPRRSVPARVGRHEHVRVGGEVGGDRRDREGAAAAVEHEHRTVGVGRAGLVEGQCEL